MPAEHGTDEGESTPPGSNRGERAGAATLGCSGERHVPTG